MGFPFRLFGWCRQGARRAPRLACGRAPRALAVGRRSHGLTVLRAAMRALAVPLLVCAFAAPLAWLSAESLLTVTRKQLEQIERDHGTDAVARILEWQELMRASRSLQERDKLELVNRFFNSVRFVSDEEHWGVEDYWATPVEFLATNGGDCEDFSIAKYFTLKELGVEMDRLRLTYVKALALDQAHMVLAYYPTPDAEPLILDNLVPDIRPASRRQDLLPVYSFNGDGLWLGRERGQGRLVGHSSRLGLWSDLVRRMGQAQIDY
jgi:predicted transglutaminase-like cysteine proteinase